MRGYKPFRLPQVDGAIAPIVPRSRRVVGVDVFVETNLLPEALGKALEDLAAGTPFRLKMISNRGTQVYPPPAGSRTWWTTTAAASSTRGRGG